MHEYIYFVGFPGGTRVKDFACQYPRCKRCGFDPWIRKISWRRKWLPTLVFLWPVEDGLERRKIGGQGTQEFFNSSDQQEAKGEGSRPF